MFEIVRGSTPTIKIRIPFPDLTVETGIISIEQNRTPVIVHKLGDGACQIIDGYLMIGLMQEETFSLSPNLTAFVRGGVKYTTGLRYNTDPVIVEVIDFIPEDVL